MDKLIENTHDYFDKRFNDEEVKRALEISLRLIQLAIRDGHGVVQEGDFNNIFIRFLYELENNNKIIFLDKPNAKK